MNMKIIIILMLLSAIILEQTPQLFGQGPCIPSFNSTHSHVNNVAFHTMINLYSGVNESGYVTFPSALFTTTVAIGKKYPINVSDEDLWYGNRCAVWIDYNNDNQFADSERVLSDTVQSPSLSGIVSIPLDSSYIGERRMRVMCVWSTGGVILPCDGYEEGEAEDYLIKIAATVPDSLTYCVPFNPEGADQFAIDDFKLGSIQNLNSGTNYSGYTIYSQDTFTTDLIQGNSYPIYFCTWYPIAGITGGFAVWIDLDNDGAFADNERLFHAGPNLHTISGTIVIPSDSSFVGLRRMRIRSEWNNIPTDPCSLYKIGESEDYTINIKPISTTTSELASTLNSLTMYPNPSQGRVQIESDKPIDLLKVEDLVGNIIFKSSPASKSIVLNIEKPGIYIVTAFLKNRISREKFVICQ